MKRANSDAQKEERRLSILAKAQDALDAQDYREIRLQDLAAGIGLVKGSFYRYFPTKQDLFMTLYVRELEAWLADWGGRFADGAADPGRLETALMDSLAARPRLIRLIGGFPGDLEPELSDAGLRSYKRFMREYLARSARALGTLNLKLADRAVPFLVSLFVLVQGSAPLCYPVARVAGILREEADFAIFRFDFRQLMAPLLRAVFAAYFP